MPDTHTDLLQLAIWVIWGIHKGATMGAKAHSAGIRGDGLRKGVVSVFWFKGGLRDQVFGTGVLDVHES